MSNADPFWVIERRDLKPSPKYLVVRREPSGFIRDFWMPDIGDATKWETQELALAHWRDCQCSDPALHVCEHSMIGTMSNADLIARLEARAIAHDAGDLTDTSSTLLRESAAEIARLTSELKERDACLLAILEADYDAIESSRGDTRYGLLDCRDNDGGYYPSQALADALKQARALVGDERPAQPQAQTGGEGS